MIRGDVYESGTPKSLQMLLNLAIFNKCNRIPQMKGKMYAFHHHKST